MALTNLPAFFEPPAGSRASGGGHEISDVDVDRLCDLRRAAAVLGIYGVTAYAVQHREREMAIRIALGVTRSAVVRMFLGDGALVLVSGIACGLLAVAALTRLLEHQLYGVRRSDPSTLLATGALMMAAGLLAA